MADDVGGDGAELREHLARLQSILDSLVDGIVEIDQSGEILAVNPATERIFGYASHDVVGKNVKVLMPAPFRDEHDEYLRRYLAGGKPRIIGFGREVRGRRRDGSGFPLYLAVSKGFRNGKLIFTGIVRDLGVLREAEQRAHEAEQLAALSTITAGITHDVGTPMTTILGYAELIEGSTDEEKNRKRATHIVEQVRRVTDLLRTLLNIARPRRAEPEPLNVVDILDHSVDFFREKLRGHGIAIERDYESRPALMADRDRLEQVFLNLIVNAADAMPNGGRLRLGVRTPDPDVVEIRIEDSGIGIPPEVVERVFDAFYTTKERGKGTGLGLLVSQQIVRDHGGRIHVESEVGEGTRFVIKLPVDLPRTKAS
ncbi:MAG: nitrogen regulation protein NR(II) [Myxococcota bacterium]